MLEKPLLFALLAMATCAAQAGSGSLAISGLIITPTCEALPMDKQALSNPHIWKTEVLTQASASPTTRPSAVIERGMPMTAERTTAGAVVRVTYP